MGAVAFMVKSRNGAITVQWEPNEGQTPESALEDAKLWVEERSKDFGSIDIEEETRQRLKEEIRAEFLARLTGEETPAGQPGVTPIDERKYAGMLGEESTTDLPNTELPAAPAPEGGSEA